MRLVAAKAAGMQQRAGGEKAQPQASQPEGAGRARRPLTTNLGPSFRGNRRRVTAGAGNRCQSLLAAKASVMYGTRDASAFRGAGRAALSCDVDGSQTVPTIHEDGPRLDATATVTLAIHAQLRTRRTRRQVDSIAG
jgi:hypothetical protein